MSTEELFYPVSTVANWTHCTFEERKRKKKDYELSEMRYKSGWDSGFI